MILAIGQSCDTEFEAFRLIKKAVNDRGEIIILFCQDKCLDGESIFFKIVAGVCKYFIKIDGEEICVDDFDAVLYLHPQVANKLVRYEPKEHANFILHQFLELRKGIWTIFRNKKWINDPWNVQIAENKAYQLTLASSVGFKVPDTVITSDPDEVRDFYDEHFGNIITKIIIPTPILDHVIYTNRVTEEQMRGIDSVKLCPSIFQEEVEKEYELRITVVGSKIFAAKVHSQDDDETKVDWRKKPKLNDFSVRLESCVLPEEVCDKIQSFMRLIGLRYGCIDMIVTPQKEYVFLEINPSGQWYFVQMKTNLDIATAIAELILG